MTDVSVCFVFCFVCFVFCFLVVEEFVCRKRRSVIKFVFYYEHVRNKILRKDNTFKAKTVETLNQCSLCLWHYHYMCVHVLYVCV